MFITTLLTLEFTSHRSR